MIGGDFGSDVPSGTIRPVMNSPSSIRLWQSLHETMMSLKGILKPRRMMVTRPTAIERYACEAKFALGCS